MLDLKAKLAAAGVVSAKQVKEFDEKEAKSKDAKRRKPADSKKPQDHRKPNRSGKSQSSNKRGGSRNKKTGSKTATDAATLKTLNRGEAYVRIRKVVEHSRLDDKEQTIPGVDDQTFNFVTMKGRIGKLYVTIETAQKLKEGQAAISAFMSHHGLSHCVLPKNIALDFAQVFPLWLRHLRGHEAAGQIEAPPEEADASKTESSAKRSPDKTIPDQATDESSAKRSSDKTIPEQTTDESSAKRSSDKTIPEQTTNKTIPDHVADEAKSAQALGEAKSAQASGEANSEHVADEAKSEQALGETKSEQVSEAVQSVDKMSPDQAKDNPSSTES